MKSWGRSSSLKSEENLLENLIKDKPMMVIDKIILDELTEAAKASPRLRMNYDLRNSAEDRSVSTQLLFRRSNI